MKGIFRMFGKDRRRPLDPEPKLGMKQMNLKDFNTQDFNNNSTMGVMEELDVDCISFQRGGVDDE